jgi:hypothetical protein
MTLLNLISRDWKEAGKVNLLMCFMPIPYGAHIYLFAISSVPFEQFIAFAMMGMMPYTFLGMLQNRSFSSIRFRLVDQPFHDVISLFVTRSSSRPCACRRRARKGASPLLARSQLAARLGSRSPRGVVPDRASVPGDARLPQHRHGHGAGRAAASRVLRGGAGAGRAGAGPGRYPEDPCRLGPDIARAQPAPACGAAACPRRGRRLRTCSACAATGRNTRGRAG